MALPGAHRLRHRKDFSAVYQAGLRLSTPHLTVRALRQPSPPNPSAPEAEAIACADQPTQIGVSISQKVSKRAVVRNRIKRQIRATIQALLPQISHGWKIVVVVRPGAIQCDYQQFLQELRQLLVDAEVIHGN